MTSEAIPGFRVLRPLGAGGMASVYLVEPDGLPETVRALKVMQVHDAARRERFVREAELLARVDDCPGVVRIHGAGEHGALLWICMEHVDGNDLARVLATRGPLPWEEVVRLGRDVALGLAAVHERGIVHRDLKPANILLDARGEPKLVDFGIAQATDLERLTLSGAVMGTPAFFSPEQARGRAIDGRSDVYSLAATLYEVLTGTVPFPDDQGLPALMTAILIAEPEAPSARRGGIPRAVDAVLLDALLKDPERRPDARAFARQLDACLDDPHAAAGPRLWTRGRRRALIVTLAAAPGVAFAALAMTIRDPVATERVVTPVARTPVARPEAPQVPGPFAPLLEHARRRELLAALASLNQLRDLRRSEVGQSAVAAELTVRRELAQLVAEEPLRLEDLAAGFKIVRGLRELADLESAADPLADATLDLFRRRMEQLEEARAQTFDPGQDVVLLESLCDSGLRPADPSSADQALDAAFVCSTFVKLPPPQYYRVLLVMVRFDVDLQRDHVRSVEPAPGLSGGVWLDFLNLRIKGTDYLAEPARKALAAELLALVQGPRGSSLGPVSRARGLWQGVNAFNDPTAAMKLLDRAAELDPRTPWPAFQRTSFHLEWRQYPEAARWAHEAITRVQRDDHDKRPSMILFETFHIYRVCMRAFIKTGDLARAGDLIARLETFDERVKFDKLDELKAELAAAQAARPPQRPSDF